jgi:hypothetical protein
VLMAITPKREKFISNILAGMNQTDAYKDAYDVSSDCLPATVYTAAYDLMNNPEIKGSIQAARDSQRGWTLARVVEEGERNLSGAQADHSWPAANGALAFLGKVTNTVTERPVTESVSITRVTIVLDSGTSLSLESNAATSLSEPGLEPGLEAGSEPSDTTASH